MAELCRKEGINQNLYYRWSKEFLEAGKKRLETLAEVLIENRLLKKSVLGDGEDASVRLQMLWDNQRFWNGGSGSFGLEFRRLSTDVAIVAV